MGSRTRGRIALALASAALAVRLGYLAAVGPPPVISADALEYHSYAQNLLRRRVFLGSEGGVATRTPGYPVFLAAVYALFGPSPLAACAAQAVLGALACLLLFEAAGFFLKPPWPGWCALAAALYADLVTPTASLLSESLLSFFLSLALFCLYRDRWPAARRALFYGLVCGAAYLVRPEVLLYGAPLCCLLPLVSPRFTARHAALALAALALPVFLWSARNLAVLGTFVPGTTAGGRNAYLGLRLPLCQNRCAEKDLFIPPPGTPELEQGRLYAQAFRQLKAALTPAAEAKAYVYNLLTLFYPFLPQYDATFVLLAPFWLFALWGARSRPGQWPLALPVLCSAAVFTFLGGPVSRYRFGFSPLLVMLAALGLHELHGRLGRRRFLRWAGAWAGAQALLWLAAPQARQAVLTIKETLWR